MEVKQIVVVGAGFAGLGATQSLAKSKNAEVTIIDRRNHHLFQPLLYQVAMAGLSPAEIAVPIRSEFTNQDNVRVILGEVKSVDLNQQCVTTGDGDIPYDMLVLACGANHSYFGQNQWEPFAPGLKTIEQATEIRRRVLLAFEKAEITTDPKMKKKHLTFVVVGAGPTGVELAGSLGELSRFTLSKDFKNIDPSQTRIILVEAGKRILSQFSPSLTAKAARQLESLGVTIWTESLVTTISEDGIQIGDESVMASTVLWAAGVKPSPLNEQLNAETDRVGRVVVEPDLSLKNHPEVFVLGDQACSVDQKTGEPLPGLAPVAIQQGRHTGRNIRRRLDGQETLPFKYFDKGIMATIGRMKAIVETKHMKLTGSFAWYAWLFVHIYYLIGFRNKVFVLLQWATSYLRFKKGARLIAEKSWRAYDD